MDKVFKNSEEVFKAMKFKKIILLCLIPFLLVGCSMFGIRDTEEISYDVKHKEGDFEIRQYPDRLIAQTTVAGSYKDSQSKAFRRLFNYISGQNVKKTEIAMTAPVTEKKANLKIAMTAPVTREPKDGAWTMGFAMPAQFKSLAELPSPLDSKVELVKRPAALFAVLRFTWRSNEERNQEKLKELQGWLEKNKEYKSISAPTFAGYDPPWTIPFLRRQEVMLEVQKLK